MRRMLAIALAVPALAGLAATVAGADATRTYKIEMYNAFGVVEGSDVRVAGVNAGTVTSLDVTPQKRAVITVELQGDLAELGEDTTCSSEPQSLIAEYFIDCSPEGPLLPEGGTIPASQVQQTVQPDLVQNTLREPFKARLRLLINEFGTALAGNPESLNEAIRLGAPALGQLQEATEILANQGSLIRDLNANSETIIGELSRQRAELVRFFDEAEDAGAASAARRDDLSRDFDTLDDFLAELNPMLTQLDSAAREQTPLLADLRAAAPGLNQLAIGLQPFNRAFEKSMVSLGDAGRVGRRALRRGADEIELLAEAGKNAPITAEMLADLLRDLDDPRRIVEIDDRAEATTGRTGEEPGTRNTKGYTGLEGLLNYPYYQTLAINQFDQVSHLFHFGLYGANSPGPCGSFSTGRDPSTGDVIGVPAEADGETTTNILEADNCVGWAGPNQPGLNEDLNLPKYHPSVCPEGTAPERARIELCDPADAARASSDRKNARGAGDGGGPGSGGSAPPSGGDGGGPLLPGSLPVDHDDVRDQLEDLLDLPGGALDDAGVGGLGLGDGRGGRGGGRGGGAGGAGGQATEDLLDFLLGP